jgi:type IV pilus assembly protein PilW
MNASATHRTVSGFSLVEIMVAMVIGLIGILVIFQVFAVSEGYRRTTTSGGDAQQNGAVAMYILEHEMRQAGWGFNSSNAIGCNVHPYDASQGGALTQYPLVPVRITQGAANASDTVEVNYGSQASVVAPTNIFQNMVASTDAYVVGNRYGFAVADVFIVVESGKDCTLAQVTGLPAAPLTTTVNHSAASPVSRYNDPAGSGILYTVNGFIFNLGSAPAHNIYSVSNSNLVLVAALNSATAQTVADNVVQMKAQYGKDDGGGGGTPGDGIVDTYDNVTPTTAAQWSQVLAVRIGIVARAATPEKPSGTGGCDTTTVAPTWVGGTFNLTADANWQCYRYKIFQNTIPVRNMLWSQG